MNGSLFSSPILDNFRCSEQNKDEQCASGSEFSSLYNEISGGNYETLDGGKNL